MTIEEYKDLLLEDELKIGYDLSEEYEEYEEEEESYIDGYSQMDFMRLMLRKCSEKKS